MQYIVMEVFTSYAVVLDEEGHFLKVANMRYQVGQKVDRVIQMQEPVQIEPIIIEPEKALKWKWVSVAGGLATVAACFVLVAAVHITSQLMPYGSVYMTINPEVRIDVNRNDIVVDLEGINEEGSKLIEGYSYRKKDLEQVMNELVDSAVEMEYLEDGEQIVLELDADDADWMIDKGNELEKHMDECVSETISVIIRTGEIETIVHPIPTATPVPTTTPMPIATPTPIVVTGDSEYGDSEYGSSESGDSEYEVSQSGNSGYTRAEDGDSDYSTAIRIEIPIYEDIDSGYGESSYNTPEVSTPIYSVPSNQDNGNSDYGESDYTYSSDSSSDYSSSDYEDDD